ncbi:MAG: 50S ribosomal protein L4 [Candidatus Portnoybacteria bacterium]|nr:50S ribosomal protein L4 [Candidatus Portnoybacteria bacterium]MDD4982584.1 50S ribosomal protein L4 [Candidatus Portnoybacteria bacterium]
MAPVKKIIKKPAVKEKAAKKEPVTLEQSREAGLSVAVFSQDGKELSNISLPSEIFGLKVNSDLVAQAATAQMANSRENIAHAKDRSEVRGGGKKPWKQKGTGRARHASIRSPLWAGGGVTFGPRAEKNFSVKINKKMKRQALFMVLSGKLRDGELVILDELKLKQAKTKDMARVIEKLAAGSKKDLAKGAMIVLAKKDEMVFRAAKNLPKIMTMGVNSLNVVDLLSSRYLLMPKEAIEKIKETFIKA